MATKEMKRRWGKRIIAILLLTHILGVVSLADAKPTKGIFKLSIIGGFAIPLGDLASNKYYGASAGASGGYGLEFYPISRLGIGAYFTGDFDKVKSFLIAGRQIEVKDFVVPESGLLIKYYFQSRSKLQPYLRVNLGTSWLSVTAKSGLGADSKAKFNLGIGGGAMYVFSRLAGISGDIIYSHSGIEGSNAANNRIGFRAALHLGY
jgi:hypothetical protein